MYISNKDKDYMKSIYTHRSLKNFAFTLAEVLITLGVIGVVAAITMPVLTKQYQHKVLESQFKKTYAEISQLSNEFLNEFGGCQLENKDEMAKIFKKKFKVLSNKNYSYVFKTYNRNLNTPSMHSNCLTGGSYRKTITISDGRVIALCWHQSDVGNLITIDTNGYKKGPNALGHDIFLFRFDLKNCKLGNTKSNQNCTGETGCPNSGWKGSSQVCSKTSTSNSNGLSCSSYAMQNKCPDDSSKNYWECLP